MLAGSWLVAAALLSLQAPPGACSLPGLAEPARIPGVSFEELQRRADTAWDAQQLPEALRFYRAGVELNPRWVGGLWRLGLLFWMGECPLEARGVLGRLLDVAPDSAQAWAVLGISEYRLQEYDQALLHLTRGAELGMPSGAIAREARRTAALLFVRRGDYGGASRALSELVQTRPDDDDDEILMACGLAALRMPLLPSEVDAADRDLVRTAGRAVRAALATRMEEAWQRFDELVARYPETRGVHLAYGIVLSKQADPRARAMLQKEVDLFPDSAEAQGELAFEILHRGDPADALGPARAAAQLNPGTFASTLALGEALLATGATEEAIAALEEATRLDPDRVEPLVALARAYLDAGRTRDVARARERLTELYSRIGAQ